MSLSIDEEKLEELVRTTPKSYTVTSSNLAPVTLDEPIRTEPVVSGTTYSAPVRLSPEAREYMLSLRRKIEESGKPLKTVAELDALIEEVKGKNRRR